MSYIPAPSESSFELPPAGTFPALCYRVIDLGTQQSSYLGQTKMQHKILLSWELCDDDAKMSDGRPFSISQRYTWSMHEKAVLRKHLEAWRGTPFKPEDFGSGGFNIKSIIGVPCYLQIVHTEKDGKTYANIAALMKLPKTAPKPVAQNDHAYLWLDPELFDREVFSSLSDNLQAVIKASPEYRSAVGGEQSNEHIADENIPAFHDDPIPF